MGGGRKCRETVFRLTRLLLHLHFLFHIAELIVMRFGA